MKAEPPTKKSKEGKSVKIDLEDDVEVDAGVTHAEGEEGSMLPRMPSRDIREHAGLRALYDDYDWSKERSGQRSCPADAVQICTSHVEVR